MPRRFAIDDASYEAMLCYLNGTASADRCGAPPDIQFINEDFWLQDTAVIENIELRNGEWTIYLVFAHHLRPLKFIKRKIVNFACPKKAGLSAHYMRRQAAKDQRGTLVVNSNLIKQSFN